MTPAYKVTFPDLASKLINIVLTLNSSGSDIVLRMPAWIPGSYMIRDFAMNVITLRASTASGELLVVEKLDKQCWYIVGIDDEIIVEYQVYANDLSVRSAHVDNSHVYFNGASLFLAVDGCVDSAHSVSIFRPKSEIAANWEVATTLPSVQTDSHGFGEYTANDYEHLIDHPVEIANLAKSGFVVDGIEHRIAIYGQHNCDFARLNGDLLKICKIHSDLFGELPIQQYLFIVTAVGEGYGGLEHMDSTSLICERDDLPDQSMDGITDGYRRFLGLCSHEYFHLWNVKRIRPSMLKEADLSKEVYTTLLWAFEGITSYYDDLALVRSRVITHSSYLELLAQVITRVSKGAGRKLQSVAQSSFDAWTKFYKQGENAPDAIVSYYAKGALIAFGLDITLRRRSDFRLSLDDFMRLLWERHGKTDIGVGEDDIQLLAEELLGQPLDDFFDAYVFGTEELPIKEWLHQVGIGMQMRASVDQKDHGKGFENKPESIYHAKPVLGARFGAKGEGVEILSVYGGGAAQKCGLAAGDVVVAVDGLKVNSESLYQRISRLNVEKTVNLHAFRRDELICLKLRPQLALADTCDLWLLAESEMDGCVERQRADWFGDA